MTLVHSKLHMIVDTLLDGTPMDDEDDIGMDIRRDLAMVLQTVPMFVFSDESMDLLIKSPQAQKSMSTLAEHKLIHLPYPEMLVQWTMTAADSTPVTYFVLFHEKDNQVRALDITLFSAHKAVRIARKTAVIECKPDQIVVDLADDVPDRHLAGKVLAFGMQLAVLMQHVGGLDREVVEPQYKLNKRRAAKGKSEIRGYQYVHIGKVYDSSGREHSRTGNGTGRHMPVHLRAGHVRNQFYGKERSQRKLIWIPPVIVNYDSGEEQKQVVKRVVR